MVQSKGLEPVLSTLQAQHSNKWAAFLIIIVVIIITTIIILIIITMGVFGWWFLGSTSPNNSAPVQKSLYTHKNTLKIN